MKCLVDTGFVMLKGWIYRYLGSCNSNDLTVHIDGEGVSTIGIDKLIKISWPCKKGKNRVWTLMTVNIGELL